MCALLIDIQSFSLIREIGSGYFSHVQLVQQPFGDDGKYKIMVLKQLNDIKVDISREISFFKTSTRKKILKNSISSEIKCSDRIKANIPQKVPKTVPKT